MSRVASVYLSKDERDRFMKVCEKEGCSAYSLAKKALLDHIWAYPLEKALSAEGEDIKPDLGEVDITDTPEPETSEIDVEEVSERVKKILEGKVE